MSHSITTLRVVLSPVLRRSIPVTSRSLRRTTYDRNFSFTTASPSHSSHPLYSTISKTPDSASESEPEPESESKLKPDLKKLKNKTVLITGATRGIGRAIAEGFASEGARCLLVGRDEVRLRGVREGLRGWGGGEGERGHEVLVGDVGRREFWGREFEKDIDILVNAAGITHYSLLATTKKELLDEVVQTNLMGTVWGCQVVGKGMMRRRSGCIINVASLLGVKGGRGSTVYAASKAGVIALTRSLAAEVGSMGIRVNVIVPGYIETDMTTAMTPEARTQALKDIPLNRFGYTSEIADAAVFLATNAYANNCILNIDGGLSAT